MEATRRQSQEPEDRRQRHKRARTIDGLQDPEFGASIGQTLVRQRESGGAKEGEGEPKQCGQLLHASAELQDFLLELQCLQIRDIETHHDRLSVAKPTTRRGARHAEIRGDGHVPGALDEIPKPVIVAPLTAARACHGDDHRPFAQAAQVLDTAGRPTASDGPLSDENSLPKVHNVLGDRSALGLSAGTSFGNRTGHSSWRTRNSTYDPVDVTNAKMVAYSSLAILVALYVVGAISVPPGSLRHEVQTLPLWFPIVLGFQNRDLAKWAALPCLVFWLAIMIFIWLFLLGWARIVTGHFFPTEVAMTLVVGLASFVGLVACLRWRTTARATVATTLIIVFAVFQLLAIRLSLYPYVASR